MKYKFAVICASNQNRSMEAHKVLSQNNFNISSYGTGSAVRLPGPSIDKPNVYSFGTPYDDIYKDLVAKDAALYEKSGLLAMLDRNRNIKTAPEKFQENRDFFDFIITCEERVFDAVCEDVLGRDTHYHHPIHVINVEITDNNEQAIVGGRLILKLATMIENANDIDNEMEDLLSKFEQETNANILHTVTFI